MGRKLCIILLGFLALLLGGCGSDSESGEYVVYYLNMEGTKLVTQAVELEHTGRAGMVDELLAALQTQPEDTTVKQTIPSDVEVLGYDLESYQITVDFSKEYYNLSPTEEVLTRAAIVKTLLQVEAYSYVMFTVESEPLENHNGLIIGSMNEDSFVENPGQQINSSQQTTLTLYFANEDGTALVEEERIVYYSSNISLEKLVMEQLMEGPKISGAQSTIPTGTKLINVSVADGICYVSLDETFLNQNQEITEQVVLFSIVNSLTELANVEKVQLSINGDTSGKCRYTYDLATLYEADESMIQPEASEEIESTE